MKNPPRELLGERLSPEEYLRDFDPRFWRITENDFWKFERRQSFQEQGNSSWDAFARGDWSESLKLLEDRTENLKSYFRRVTEQGFTTYRVRVVEEPLTPYMQWLIHSQRQRSEYGGHVRIVGVDEVAPFESDGTLPEIVTVGSEAIYQVLYDADGVLEGAIRSDAPEDLASWRDFMMRLYATGEDIADYFERVVETLPPPDPGEE
ncbi:DUF6879 family protein [Saccharopolyspora elongata]|uniref:DUF6879 domain-containing protein n=1 Tax=Saccharopolyspora elongata TaxID=2530387 RepID=A0A4R4YHB8_9PSEU|nr:DUF6879 family protein [Saccharopolyspora elongata]TDD44271.1 hypothetical protein E1288_24425 [Saccharopolyspora elongata]